MVGLEDCESLFTQLEPKKMADEKYLVRSFSRIKQALGQGELDGIYWLLGTEHPADGPTKVRSDMGPLLRILESGRFNPGTLRLLKGVSWKGGLDGVNPLLLSSRVLPHCSVFGRLLCI